MTSCDEIEQASSILDEVLGLLDETVLEERIYAPIDRALIGFRIRNVTEEPINEHRFIDIVTQFMVHMYKRGVPLSRTLSLAQARAEAIDLLERHYQGLHANGYAHALLDARRLGEEGTELVLADMAAAMKAIHQERYLDWVVARHIAPLNWQTKRDLVRALLERWRTFLPEDMAACPAEQLTCVCASLIRAFTEAHRELTQISITFVPGRTRY